MKPGLENAMIFQHVKEGGIKTVHKSHKKVGNVRAVATASWIKIHHVGNVSNKKIGERSKKYHIAVLFLSDSVKEMSKGFLQPGKDCCINII